MGQSLPSRLYRPSLIKLQLLPRLKSVCGTTCRPWAAWLPISPRRLVYWTPATALWEPVLEGVSQQGLEGPGIMYVQAGDNVELLISTYDSTGTALSTGESAIRTFSD